jgi:hypothetical protein
MSWTDRCPADQISIGHNNDSRKRLRTGSGFLAIEAGIVVLICEFLLPAVASSLALESRSALGDQFAFRAERLARSTSIQSHFSTDSRSFFMDTKDTKIPGNLVSCVDWGEGRDGIDGG